MRQHYEYRVCHIQQSRVTYVNGNWQGKLLPSGDKVEAALASCMQTWDYLHGAGEDGWELVGALAQGSTSTTVHQVLYLKRNKG